MKIAPLSCCLLALLVLAGARSAAAETCQASDPAVFDVQVLPEQGSAAPWTPAEPEPTEQPSALPSDPLDGRLDAVCFWYPTGQCCAGGYQIEEWICDPDLTRCGPRRC
jgi:hypothetical protein